jgi:hypothetical protein
LGFWVKVAGPGVCAVVHAFCTIAVGVIGVMGMETEPQLHFDGEPGTAAVTNGQPVLGSLWQKRVPPGCCQLVQFGSTNVVPTAGHTILLIGTVTN